ncbi:MAG: hypothetical protein KGJ64_12135 [Betaproteobacteria bacterium]|nr:hypothetical protein [Betaproteobacteria bacterium]
MSTNSRPGRQHSVDRDEVFALALERTHPPQAPEQQAEAAHAAAAALLSRLGRVRPLDDQVPPT